MYVDNLGVLGTSRVNVDRDLAMAVQTLKNRGLATHEEAVRSETTTLRWTLRKTWQVLFGTHDFCGSDQMWSVCPLS